MAHAVDQAGAVPGPPVKQFVQIGAYLTVVLPVLDVLADVMEHLHDLFVGAAVAGTLQRAHGGGDGGIDVGAGGGEHPAGEGGVVAAAVFGVEHQTQVQQPGLLLGKLVVVADGVEEILRHAQALLRPVEVEGLLIVIVPLHRKGVGDDGGAPGHQSQGLEQLVLQGGVLRPGIIGVQGQDRTAQLIHHVGARGLEDHILGEAGRERAILRQDLVEGGQLVPGGQGAEQQQIGCLLKAEAALGHKAVDQVLHVDAAVDEPALHRDLLAVLHIVALDVADLGDAGHDAGAVGVAEAPLDVDILIVGGVNGVMLLELPA